MRGSPRFPAAADPRVVEILAEYLASLDAGAAPDREGLLARHPEFDRAIAAYDRAIGIDPNCTEARGGRARCVQRAALAADPANAKGRRFLAVHYKELSAMLLELGHARAAAAAAGFAERNPESSDSLYEAGVRLVACAEMAAKDANLEATERARVARAYAEQAKAILVRATQLAPGEPSHRIALGRAGPPGPLT